MRGLLLPAALLAAGLAVLAAGLVCDESAARAPAQARFLDGHADTGTSPQQPAVVMPIAQLPYIPNLRLRVTLTRESEMGGGTVQWWLQWVQPYAVEVTGRVLAHGRAVFEGDACLAQDADALKRLYAGAVSGACVRIEGDDLQSSQLCFQETGVPDMLPLHSPLARQESYEFFLFFHFVVKPFCRVAAGEGCWGNNDDLGRFHSLQPHVLYRFSVYVELALSDCSTSAGCRLLSQLIHDVSFYAVFHIAPGDVALASAYTHHISRIFAACRFARVISHRVLLLAPSLPRRSPPPSPSHSSPLGAVPVS
jgi:hypothetical protein